MTILGASAILLSIAAVFGYLNCRYLKLPTTIGIMAMGLVTSLLFLLLSNLYPAPLEGLRTFINGIDFNTTLMEGMLSYLLFAGALHVNLDDLREQKWIISILATIGVVLSTFLIGTAFFFIVPLFGIPTIPFIWCLIFGAIVSPTDPVAVLGILKTAGAPNTLKTKITGESLFNDGVGVVVYLALVGIATGSLGHGDHGTTHETIGAADIAKLFILEAGGGILLGGILGYLCYRMLKSIDNYQIEVLITLALVTGGYQLALLFHLSGPLAMVVAGLMIGNQGRTLAMSDSTRDHLDKFWELLDEILNALLFLLIGLELLIVEFKPAAVMIGVLFIFITLGVRFFSISIPVFALKSKKAFTPGVIRLLTWGGIRGGISVALALALPKDTAEQEATRSILLTATYLIVIFSILVQGLTLKPLIQKMLKTDPSV